MKNYFMIITMFIIIILFVKKPMASADVSSNGFNIVGAAAVLKDDFSMYDFTDDDLCHMYTVENNSNDSIYITNARVIVHQYDPLNPDEYVIIGGGDGFDFDRYLGLYSYVGASEQSYDAYPVIVYNCNEYDKSSVIWDPILNQEVKASDALNIICFTEFADTGKYSYELVLDYEYNGKKNVLSLGKFNVLYDYDDANMRRASQEYSDNMDYYDEHLR